MDRLHQALFGTPFAEASWLVLGIVLLVGFALLANGANWMVDGSARLATRAGIRPLVVGLTVVAWGTSAPEVVVSSMAAARGNVASSLGNVLGSNLANIGLVLGSCALVLPRMLEGKVERRELFWLFVSFGTLWFVCYDREVSRLEGTGLLAVFAVHTVQLLRSPGGAAVELEEFSDTHPMVHVLLGSVSIAVGSYFVLESGQVSALRLGMNELVVGLAVLAIGTSLPELAAGLRSALKGHGDISLGNVIGSNVFNALAVIGIAALIQPFQSDPLTDPEGAAALDTAFGEALRFDFPAVLLFSLVVAALPWIGSPKAGRLKGVALLGLYTAYWVVRQSR